MTDNKTSKAIDEWIENMRDGIEYDEMNGFEDEEHSRLWMKKGEAIAQKYRRMLAALEACANCCHDHCTDSKHSRLAEDAISFDPLSDAQG